MRTKLLTLFVFLTVVSCQKAIIEDEKPLAEENITNSRYAISKEAALENLEQFLSNDGASSKSSDIRIVKSIVPIRCPSNITKGQSDEESADNLLYIANFEQNRGYAILAADNRIKDKVIAVIEDGQLSEATMYSAMSRIGGIPPLAYPGYPAEGEGFFTTPETGDEVFMNPNTVDLYDATEDDTLVGNFEVEEDTGTRASSSEFAPIPELLTSALCLSYASSYVINPGGDPGADPGDNTGGGNGYQEQVVSSWREMLKVNPILEDYVYWRQDEPFNDLCPDRRYYLIAGKSRKAPAGCFPLAIAKIMTLFEVPSIYTFNGNTIDWDSLKESDYPYSDVAKSSAATLLYAISSGCNSLYFYEGTFTFPNQAESYMESVQFSNVNSVDYNFDTVTGMLRNGKPLIIYAMPGRLNLKNSHSWNIDGYKVKQRTITTNTYVDNILQDSSSTIETCRMVHCDFGWKGTCNGYYVSGVFKLDDSSIEHDSSDYSGSTNFSNYINLITYDLP